MLLRTPCSVLKAASLAALAVGAMACEPMDPSGKPLSPVPVVAAVPGMSPGAVDLSKADPRFEGDDPVTLKSEDLRVDTEDGASGAGGAVRVGSTVTPHTDAGATPAAPQADAAAPVVAASAPASSSAMGGWPVRLVRTHLDEQPPSAILALPDGRRIVVSPGDMVPERGLVVMAIGKERVHLAEVSSVGDHATVTPIELTAQY